MAKLRQGHSVQVDIRCGKCQSRPAIGSVTFSAGARGQEVSRVKALRRVGKNWPRPAGHAFLVMGQDRQLRIVKRHEGGRLAEQTIQRGEVRARFRCLNCGEIFTNQRTAVVDYARHAAIAGENEVLLIPGNGRGQVTNQESNLLRNTN